MTEMVAIIGAGQIGHACAKAFTQAGWRTRIYARNAPEWSVDGAQFERYEVCSDATPPMADCVVDTIAFDEGEVERYDPEKVGRLITISSASVYRDPEGRTLDEAAANGFPDFPDPILETNATVDPGPGTYSTRKVRMELRATELFGDRSTVLRPCAIYGPCSRHPREWWFVKRMLDGRRHIPVALRGTSRFHTTDVEMIAQAALAAAQQSIGGIFNVADADPPSVAEIGTAIAEIMDCEATIVPVEGAEIGRTPWSVPKPFLINTDRSVQRLGIAPSYYSEAANDAVLWLSQRPNQGWRDRFPQLAAYPWDLFHYGAEEVYFTRHTI